ncbi:MAG: NAD(P)-binding protein [Acidimicrobiia bacterium]|nr:NAD(P)-binding protein [Acidimicrobiia bacterium]
MRSPLPPRHETVIIGGGIAGLACGRRLQDRQRPFLLITETIGGRIRSSADGTVNLGAYYVRSDYRHVNRFVDRGRRMRRRDALRGNHNGSFTRSDSPVLLHLPQAVRFLRLMSKFRRRYETFRQDCLQMSQAEAIRADRLLFDLYHEPAPRFIQRHRIEDIARSYLTPLAQGTGFTSLDRLTAFTMLVGALPMIVPMFEFTFRFDLLMADFEEPPLFDSVIEVTPAGSHYVITTRANGTFTADNVVVATPIGVSATLLDLGPVKSPIHSHTFLVRGNLRPPWSRAAYSLFPEADPTLAIARQADGSTLFCSVHEHPDFGEYFDTWQVVEHQYWNPAFHLEGDALLECEQGPGLYLIGDHNVCSLEDAYITGVYAANRILSGFDVSTATSPDP